MKALLAMYHRQEMNLNPGSLVKHKSLILKFVTLYIYYFIHCLNIPRVLQFVYWGYIIAGLLESSVALKFESWTVKDKGMEITLLILK